MPVISNLVYTVTDSTIVATWTTDVSSDSNLTAGGKAAIDNGVAANSTSHQCVVTGLLANTLYSCVVTSGGTSSSPQNVTTAVAQTRLRVTSATMGSNSETANSQLGDTYRTFVSNDNKTYITQDDGNGFTIGAGHGRATQLGVLTDETQMTGTNFGFGNYGGSGTTDGTDGPGGAAMGNKSTGLFGLNGNLHMMVYRQFPPTYSTNRYGNWIKSTNHGTSFNNFNDKTTFTNEGNPVLPHSPSEPVQFYDLTIGLVAPVLYAADDGTLGYNTAGNQIDGANAYVYCSFHKDTTPLYLMRIPRIQYDAQTTTAFEYWVGPTNPTVANFVNDANWSTSPTSATQILNTGANGAWFQIAFVPAINSYIMTTWSSGGGTNFVFYSAPTPAGPWQQFFFQNNPTSGSKWYGPFPFHRDLIGNVLTNNIPVRILYQGEPGLGHYRPNWATLTLKTDTLPMPNTRIQSRGDTASQTGVSQFSLAYSSDVSVGNLLVTECRAGSNVTLNSVVFTIGGVDYTGTVVYYTQQGASGIFGGWGYIFAPASGPCTAKMNWSANNTGGLQCIAEWNGPNSARSTPAATSAASNASGPSNSVTASAGDLLVGIWAANTASACAAGAGYTLVQTGVIGANKFSALEENLSASGGSVTASFTTSGVGNWIVGIGDFFAATFNISGNVGVANATVSYSGASSGSVVADGSGNFTIPTSVNGVYTITPSLAGYAFSPVNRTVTMVSANVSGVNFTATATGGSSGGGKYNFTFTFKISGTGSVEITPSPDLQRLLDKLQNIKTLLLGSKTVVV